MFLMGIFWYHLYDMSNYKLCNLDTYNHNFGSSVGTIEYYHCEALDCLVQVINNSPRQTIYRLSLRDRYITLT